MISHFEATGTDTKKGMRVEAKWGRKWRWRTDEEEGQEGSVQKEGGKTEK